VEKELDIPKNNVNMTESHAKWFVEEELDKPFTRQFFLASRFVFLYICESFSKGFRCRLFEKRDTFEKLHNKD